MRPFMLKPVAVYTPCIYQPGNGAQIIDMPVGPRGYLHMMIYSGLYTAGAKCAADIQVITRFGDHTAEPAYRQLKLIVALKQ